MSLTMSGKTITQGKVSSVNSKPPIIIREAHIWEAYRMGEIAAKTYHDTPLTNFLSPYRQKYPSHYVRGCVHRNIMRFFNPRTLSLVACEASNPSYPIGYAQFIRLGDDEGAKRHVASRNSLWRWVLGWLFWAYYKVLFWAVGGDKSSEPKNLAAFESWPVKVHWDFPERKNRWHAQSVVVAAEFQGRGIGKKMMAEAIEKAESEGVCIGLEASPLGEHMYRSVGFKMISRYNEEALKIEEGGGFMMWTPSSWKIKENDVGI
ncbi:hypothetical protein LSUE1_G005209 [Lachnellula suecica]|uniref:N-acetyltransferase domain-containing protein n=1 Tax=Lachnellula suecica TaxID=602035 RepID=A0A8T9C6Q0_9HELO|nr:hypothetical protein LSUE1_G005209 [Lachnellula suecica]